MRPLIAIGLLAGSATAATVTGRVRVEGAAGKVPSPAGVVVWLEPVSGTTPPVAQPGAPPPVEKVVQRNRKFLPRVLAVPVGTAVDFPNADPIMHNVFSNYDGQVFDLHLFASQTTRRVVFRRAGVCRVFCNIHPEMSAVVAVVPTPYFAVTGPEGRFEIRAPAGAYRLQVWHERSVPDRLRDLEQQVTVGDNPVALSQILVSEEGYQPVAHRDKYGQEYKPAPEAAFFYPGGRR